MKKPSTERTEPTQSSECRCPASKIGPMRKEKRNMKKPCTEPIHEMLEAEEELSMCSE
jgi:hypothetical protein